MMKNSLFLGLILFACSWTFQLDGVQRMSTPSTVEFKNYKLDSIFNNKIQSAPNPFIISPDLNCSFKIFDDKLAIYERENELKIGYVYFNITFKGDNKVRVRHSDSLNEHNVVLNKSLSSMYFYSQEYEIEFNLDTVNLGMIQNDSLVKILRYISK